MFGFVAMLLLVGFVVSTRHFRRDMELSVFMATICPIAAMAVLPLAVANGGMVGLSAKGWIFTLLLTFIAGVAANGLMVYAQRTIQIGTIAVSQVVQPAIAVVWSFLLLGETVRTGQVIGIAIATVGLAAFILINQRGERARSIVGPVMSPADLEAPVVPAVI